MTFYGNTCFDMIVILFIVIFYGIRKRKVCKMQVREVGSAWGTRLVFAVVWRSRKVHCDADLVVGIAQE